MSGVELKQPDQIAAMRRSGLVVHRVLTELGAMVAPGVSTEELDQRARAILREEGAKSSFLNYGAQWGFPPFPAVTCLSVNEEVVHGIPGPRELVAGDIISIDFGAHLNGWHADAARTFAVGEISEEAQGLIDAARAATWAGIAAAATGRRIGDISAAIEASIRSHSERYGIIREYTGHGIGREMHQAPDVPNFGRPWRSPRLVPGMCLAIEPMLTIGTEQTGVLDDEWTVVTQDASLAAHWENTVALLPDGVWVLTEEDGGRSRLAELGVPFSSVPA